MYDTECNNKKRFFALDKTFRVRHNLLSYNKTGHKTMEYVQATNAAQWQFNSVPAFSAGTLHPLFASCGKGLYPTEKDSFMHIFTGVESEGITAYAALLQAQGFENVYKNEIDGNLFYQFRTPEGLFYFSYMRGTGTARFILDRCKTETAASFGYRTYKDKRGDTVFAQYSLHYDAMIKGTTCDCGMNYVYRLRDNSLVIIDGGEMEQSTDLAIKDYMAFLHELTGTSDGEKMTVALWICTHPHNDHCDFFSKLLRFHADELTVERAAFDFPAPENVRHSLSVAKCIERLAEKFPDVSYLKAHAGSRFSIANARIEVLSSAEDAVGTGDEELFPGTNETSLIFRVTADGITTLFLADCAWTNGDVLINNYSDETLSCDIVQAGHHGINNTDELYAKIKAERVLLPQCRMNMDTRFGEVYETLRRGYGEENILFANDRTDIFTCRDGKLERTGREHVGEAWDGSEW